MVRVENRVIFVYIIVYFFYITDSNKTPHNLTKLSNKVLSMSVVDIIVAAVKAQRCHLVGLCCLGKV